MDRRTFLARSLAATLAASLPLGRAIAALAPISADIPAVTGDGRRIVLAKGDLQALRDALRGPLLLPGEPGYDEARRVLNMSIDRRPALAVQPTGVADVRTAVQFARQHNLLLAVKCGGHSYSGKSTCDGGMQIDLSRLRGVRVDPSARIAYVAGGSLLGELDHEAMAFGLVTTAGTVSHTGVGGLTLGGGFGRLARRHGLALDNLEAVSLVTADGRLLRASAGENPDLFWAVRGGGGNFGVATTFEFRLHPMDRNVIGGDLVFPLARAKELLGLYSELSLDAPDELYCDAVMSAPPGTDGAFVIHACWSGAPADAERALAPLRRLGTPLKDTIRTVDYERLQRSWDNTDPRNEGEYLKSGFINEFPSRLVAAQVDGFRADPQRGTTLFFQHAGGAIGRIAPDATAFPHRRSRLNMFATVTWPIDGVDGAPHVKYLKDYWSTLEPFTDGYYTNEVANEGQAVLDQNYQGNIGRLRQVKKRYDPTNLFRLNANVQPA